MGKKSRRNRGGSDKDAAKSSRQMQNMMAAMADPSTDLANMIFYPEEPLADGVAPSGASVRGSVGHDTMFEISISMHEERLQEAWREAYAAGRADQVFDDFTPILLALSDAGIAQNSSESYRSESSTIRDSERRLRLQLSVLEHRLTGAGEESFLFVPLEAFYCNLPHELIEVTMARMGVPPNMLGAVMKGYGNSVEVYTHKHGPCSADRSRPPDKHLVGPLPFARGLRLQFAMTPTLASMFLYATCLNAGVSPGEVFVFPHALVFVGKDGDALERIVQGIGRITPSIYHRSEELWCVAGKRVAVHPMTHALPFDGNVEMGKAVMLQPGDDPVRHVDDEQFMKTVKETGCSWYPLFSDDPKSSLCVEEG